MRRLTVSWGLLLLVAIGISMTALISVCSVLPVLLVLAGLERLWTSRLMWLWQAPVTFGRNWIGLGVGVEVRVCLAFLGAY